ncbi:MAG: hypothetical protein ACRDMH_01155 [Solirubrobacterales bacterium]
MGRRIWAIFLLVFGLALIGDSIYRMVEVGGFIIGPMWSIIIGAPMVAWGMSDLRARRMA